MLLGVRRRTLANPLRWLFGFSITIAVFVLLFRRISVREVADVLRSMAPIWFAPIVVLIALAELMRAAKWALILRPLRRVRVVGLFNAIMVGYLANLVSPLRISPLVRAYVARRTSGIPTSTVLATVAVDRLADGLVSVGLLAGVLAWLPLPASLGSVRSAIAHAGWTLLALYVGVLALLLLAARAPHSGGRLWLGLGRPLPRRWRAWLVRTTRSFIRGLVLPRHWGARIGIVLFALAQKVMQVWQIQLAARAFGEHVALGPALFLVLFLGAVVLAAGALGIRGGYLAAAAVGFGWFGVPKAIGLAMGLVMDVASYGTVLIAGLISLWAEGLGMDDLRAWRHRGDREQQGYPTNRGIDGVDGPYRE